MRRLTNPRYPFQTYVEVQHWAMNHSKENWSNAWTFDPERFRGDSKEVSEDKFEALQPFSVGPRNCIGRKYVIFMTISRRTYC